MIKDRQTKRTTTTKKGKKRKKNKDHQKHLYEGNCINCCGAPSVIKKSILTIRLA